MTASTLELITRRRKQCLLHRFMYYIFDSPIISDYQYDAFERDLKRLVAEYPELAQQAPYHDICPTKFPGSDRVEDYPPEIVRSANLLKGMK